MKLQRLLALAAIALMAACTGDYESPTAAPEDEAVAEAFIPNPVFGLTGLNGSPLPVSAVFQAPETEIPNPQVLSFLSRYAAFSFLGPLRVIGVQYLAGGQSNWLSGNTVLKSAFQLDLNLRVTRGLPLGLYKARVILTWLGAVNYTVDVTFTSSTGPIPGNDVVVFNDINVFDNSGMGSGVGDPNNHIMVANLVDYSVAGPRNAGKTVWWDLGRNSVCGSGCSPGAFSIMSTVITGLGYTISEISSTSGSMTAIPADVKVIFLWTPLVAFTTAEINALKVFASEGGRIVYIGEHAGYYGAGIPIENDFLLKMGAVMTNIGQAVDCGYNDLPGASLRLHQITTGMTAVRMACSSVIVPGPNDYALYYDSSNTLVLAGVAQIDPTPLTGSVFAESIRFRPTVEVLEVPAGVNPRSSTGR